MDAEKHLATLRRNQPLPLEADLPEEVAEEFEHARQYFAVHRDARCVPLLIGAANGDSGFGMYQMVQDVLANQDPDVVRLEIARALEAGHEYHMMWVLEWAAGLGYWDLEPAVRPFAAHEVADIEFQAKAFLNLRSEALGLEPEFPDLFD